MNRSSTRHSLECVGQACAVGPIGRRELLGAALGLSGAVCLPLPAQAQAPDPALVATQLPLAAVGLEHIGTVVPDVTAAAQFLSQVFNPALYKEREQPLRYYVTLDPGYIAIGSRDGEERAFIDHDCVLAEKYDPAAMARRLELEGLPAGRFGIIRDADNLGLQLLPIGGLAGSTEPAGRLVTAPPIVRPRGLHSVLRYVSDLEQSRAFYRSFFGPELAMEPGDAAIWFAVGHTRFGISQLAANEAPRIDRFCVNVAGGGFDRSAVGELLEALGADVLDAMDEDRVYFRSPEGLGIELRPVDPARMWGRA
jgi:catechol 2,3-dioxygenase-like lactoylglutathione lyase family enzyme